jgi:hypothetical protein
MTSGNRPRRPLLLQERDFLILAMLGEFGHATTRMIWRRFWEPTTKIRSCQERLKRLFEHGLIRSFQLEVTIAGKNGGRQSTLHGLTPLGAERLEQYRGVPAPRVLRKDLKPPTLLHRQEIVEVRLAWDEACQLSGLPAPVWVHEQDCRENVPDGAAPVEYRLLYHAFGPRGQRVTCRPDAATLTVIPGPSTDDRSKTAQLVTWWEIDRGSEGLLQIRRKVPGYRAAFKNHACRQYGWGDLRDVVVRLLWVCSDTKRLEFLRETLQSYDVAQHFRFTTRKLIDPKTLLTEPVWTDVAGCARSILRKQNAPRHPPPSH